MKGLTFCLVLCQLSVDGCIANRDVESEGAKELGKQYNLLTEEQDTAPKPDEMFVLTSFPMRKGQPVYGKIVVPPSLSTGYTLTVIARTKRAPLLVTQAYERYPSEKDYDKAGVNFLFSHSNRLRIYNPKPGNHYVFFELMRTDQLSVTVTLLPSIHPGAGTSDWKPEED